MRSRKMDIMLSVIAVLVVVINTVTANSPKPNIVFIMADDLGFNDVSYHGHGEIKTPNIDELANNGVRLENYYVGPACGPTRSQFLSGKYSIHLGLYDSNLETCTKDALPLENPTIANVLKNEGYATHVIGKWHAGYHTDAHIPTNRGFDTFRGFLLSHSDHFTHTATFKGSNRKKYVDYRKNEEPFDGDDGTYSTTAFTNRATKIIRKHDSNDPLFIYLSYQAPHSPNQYPSSFTLNKNITIAKRKTYAAMVSLLDEGVGEVVDALKTARIYDNTVIIFSSDNGGANNNGASNYPLRGQKGTYFQGGIRAVGFVSSPLLDGSQKGQENRNLIHVTDWLPTFLGIAGSTVNASLNLDGYNQWNTIQLGTVSSRTEVLLNIGKKKGGGTFNEKVTAAMIDGDYKILTGRHSSDYLYPNPSDNYKAWEDVLKIRTKSKTTRLFNIKDDPTESDDLAKKDPNRVVNILAKLRTYQRGMVKAIDDEKNLTACDPANHGGYWGPWTTVA